MHKMHFDTHVTIKPFELLQVVLDHVTTKPFELLQVVLHNFAIILYSLIFPRELLMRSLNDNRTVSICWQSTNPLKKSNFMRISGNIIYFWQQVGFVLHHALVIQKKTVFKHFDEVCIKMKKRIQLY